jgi:tetratricopeptide (TPR) repeat protein
LKLQPGIAAVHYNLGNALVATDRRAEAVEHYAAALRAQPDYAEAHHNLGSVLFELGRLDEAAQHYSETLRLQPDFPNARGEPRTRARAEENGPRIVFISALFSAVKGQASRIRDTASRGRHPVSKTPSTAAKRVS